MIVKEYTCALGRKLDVEEMAPAVSLFAELLEQSTDFTQGGETWASVGEFLRAQVRPSPPSLSISFVVSPRLFVLSKRCRNQIGRAHV